MTTITDGGPFYHKLCLPITIVRLQLFKSQNYDNTTAIADTIPVATSTGSMGASHTGLGVYEYGFSMRGNTQGVSTHREPFSYTPWGFPEHGVSWHLTPGWSSMT